MSKLTQEEALERAKTGLAVMAIAYVLVGTGLAMHSCSSDQPQAQTQQQKGN